MPSDTPVSVDQRIVEAAARLPAHGGVTGWASLRWAGGSWFQGTGRGSELLPVTLALGSRHTLRPGHLLGVSQELVPPSELLRLRGVRLTSARWSVAYEMRKAATDEAAIVAFEMAAYDDLVSVEELAALTQSELWIRQGVQRVRDVLCMLEENSWSPMEPVMRLAWQLDAGAPRPRANHPVFDLSGRFVGTPDLFDPIAGVYGLYDGALHLAGEVRHADVVKEAAYRRLGLEGVTMMAGDLADRGAFVGRLRGAYARAEQRPAHQRRWLPGLPDWWVPTATVAQRRALSAHQRRRLLRYRSAA
ncbi:hypothetical protein F4692_001005 [Nocardioides cavernae]|uniref:AbiEi antitoxin C-terminal domain-containing protein n=1 Tax=Nocardioides cavernae TaxID=1921566 RepID=A0A7Y9H0U0_9ACTN|nr:hypothetical protein [Nocardioides cavernae]NYE35901.1 hypothetical protein [Nocardioides cavernae]